MDAALGWIGTIAEFFIDLIPTLGICRANHAGVKFRRGKFVDEIKPGLFWYWPVVTECVLIPTARQTLDLTPQKLQTKDDVTVTVEGVVVFYVRNVKQALVDTWDHEDTISDVALKALVRSVTRRSFEEFRGVLADGSIEEELTAICHDSLKEFGVTVREFFVSDFARCRVFAHVGGGVATVMDEEDE